MSVDPVEALRRIAYLLEVTQAETYKIRAFRNAAQTLSKMDSAEIVALSASGKLSNLPGIGKTTATVVRQALAGEVPSYLESIEGADQIGAELSERALQIKALLRGDCHSHSDWSDGGNPIEEMARAAMALGHDYLVLTDHSGSLSIANGLDAKRLESQLDVVAALNSELAPFRLLTGMEVDILEDGSLDQDEDLLGRLDVVVASVHSKLRMEAEPMTARMLAAINNPHADILGHCTGRIIVGRGRPPSSFDAAAVFSACAANDMAVEINSRPERLDPPHDLLTIVAELDCYVAIDSDAHAPGQLEWLGNGCEVAAGAGIDESRIVNTLGVDALLAWAGSHEH